MHGKLLTALLFVVSLTASVKVYADEPSVQGLKLGMTIETAQAALGDVKFDTVAANTDNATKVLVALRSASAGFVTVTIRDKLVFVQYERLFSASDAPAVVDLIAAILSKYGTASVDRRDQQTYIFDQEGQREVTDAQGCARKLDLSGTLSPPSSSLYLKYPQKWSSGCFVGLRTQIRSGAGGLVDDYKATLWNQEPGFALMQDKTNEARRASGAERLAPPKRPVPPL